MNNLRIGARVLLGFAIVIALCAAVGWYALSELADIRRFMVDLTNRDLRVMQVFSEIGETESRMRAERQQALSASLLRDRRATGLDSAASQREWRTLRDRNLALVNELQNSTARFQTEARTPARGAQWRSIHGAAVKAEAALNALSPEVEMFFGNLNRGELPAALDRMPTIVRLRRAYEAELENARRLTEEQIGFGRAAIDEFYDRTRRSIVFGMFAAIVTGVILSIGVQRSITTPLRSFMRFVEGVGKGDLRETAPPARADELGDLAVSLNRMVAGLREVAVQTRGVAEQLNAATAEILASTQQQAAGTAQQAAAVQQANATMSEIAQSGAQISERAKQVAAAAEATSTASATGLQSVQETASTMESIREQAEAVAEHVITLSEKTQAIGEIVSTVNDIAEQSHLLALNAAIEAAAAGEYGRRFAVVASEMKNLADQSKQATVQVRSILSDVQKAITGSVMLTEEAVKRVESGRRQADVADRTIRALSSNIQQSVHAFQQIVAGSNQQQIGFEQVTQAFRSISIAADQAATSTRQSEKAAANLNALAQQLRAAIEVYRL